MTGIRHLLKHLGCWEKFKKFGNACVGVWEGAYKQLHTDSFAKWGQPCGSHC